MPAHANATSALKNELRTRLLDLNPGELLYAGGRVLDDDRLFLVSRNLSLFSAGGECDVADLSDEDLCFLVDAGVRVAVDGPEIASERRTLGTGPIARLDAFISELGDAPAFRTPRP